MRPKIVEELQIIQIRSWIGKPGFCHWRQKNVLFFKCLHPRFSLKKNSQRKQPTVGDATTGFPAKWRLRNERRKTILMTRHYPDLGSTSDWFEAKFQPIRISTLIWVASSVWISSLVSQMSFRGETTGGVAKCRLFSQVKMKTAQLSLRSHLHTWKFDPGSVEINIIKTFVSADTSNWWVCYNKWVQLVHADGWFKTSQLQRGSSLGENCSPRLWSSV